jgi:hypothetical protein
LSLTLASTVASPMFSLIRQDRLIAGVTSFSEVPERLKQALLSISDMIPSRTTHEDAETLAKSEGLIPRTVAYNGFIEEAMTGGLQI